MSVTEGNAHLRGFFEFDRAPMSIGRAIRLNSKQPLGIILCDDGNAPLRGSFEFDYAPLSIETCQLAGQ